MLLRAIAAGIAILLLLGWLVGDAFGHSWYPTRCCSDRDCHPVNADEVSDDGETLTFKKLNVTFPKAKAEIGKDEDYHICILPLDTGLSVLCVFLPNNGS